MNLVEARKEIKLIAQQIVSGELAAYQGARQVWKEVLDQLDVEVPDDLWPFLANASAIEDCKWNYEENAGTDNSQLIKQCEQEIELAAKNLLAGDCQDS